MDIFCSIYGRGVLYNYVRLTDFLSNFQDISAVVNQILLQSASNFFHAGGYGGLSYLAKCSIKKSSFERFNSSSIFDKHLEKIVTLENNDLLVNQNAP